MDKELIAYLAFIAGAIIGFLIGYGLSEHNYPTPTPTPSITKPVTTPPADPPPVDPPPVDPPPVDPPPPNPNQHPKANP